LIGDEEFFIPFADYPAFFHGTVEQIMNFHTIGSIQIHWPGLDIDIELEALRKPQNYPLTFKE